MAELDVEVIDVVNSVDDVLYDVVAVRRQSGGDIRRPIAGPYDEIDARYHAKRLKAVSPDQNYIITLHHVCKQCEYLGLMAPSEELRLTAVEVGKEWDKAGEAFQIARASGDEMAIMAAQARIDELTAEGEVRAVQAAKAVDRANELSKDGDLVHTCSRYYNEAPAI